MGNTDSIPVVSQGKSIAQWLCDDSEGALKTQENFVKGCPGLSQVTSIGALLCGDVDEAIEIQKHFAKNMENMIDSTPVVGHVKGAIHLALDDDERGKEIMKSATRSTIVIGAGVGGMIVAGPVGAAAGGAIGGAYADIGITAVTDKPYGSIQAIDKVVKNKITPGELYDALLTPCFDGLAGYNAGQTYNKIKGVIEHNKLEGKVGNEAAKAAERGANNLKETLNSKKHGGKTATVIVDENGNKHTGYSYKMRKEQGINAFEDGKSSLQKQYPDIKARGSKLGEPSCAEHHAHQLATDAGSKPKVTVSVGKKGNHFVTKQRCGNCQKYPTDAFGNVPTDNIDGMKVPMPHQMEKLVNHAGGTAVCINDCDCEQCCNLCTKRNKCKKHR